MISIWYQLDASRRSRPPRLWSAAPELGLNRTLARRALVNSLNGSRSSAALTRFYAFNCSAGFLIASLKHSRQRQSWSASPTTPTCGNSVHQHDKASVPSAAPGVAPQSNSLPQLEQFFCIVLVSSCRTYNAIEERERCPIRAKAVAEPSQANKSG